MYSSYNMKRLIMPFKLSAFKILCIVITFILFIYYVIIINITKLNLPYVVKNNSMLLKESESHVKDYNVWLIFTKVNNRSPLKYKFHNLILNLLNVSSVPLHFNIIVDSSSKQIAEAVISDVSANARKSIRFSYYDFHSCTEQLRDIVEVMTPHFSSKPGTYYSDALFYVSLALYRIAPENQSRAVLLDCDLYFKKDILLLFQEFDKFKSTALFGLAPELSPVYRHVLHMYRAKHRTTFGEYYHPEVMSNETHPRGFQGYNSGVVLLNLKGIRTSSEFRNIIDNNTVQTLTTKYKFRGNLGDQDFYTLAGYEYPHLFQTLNCGFNRQLCLWWQDHGYRDVFHLYYRCNHSVVILHGNCNTKIPK